MTDDTANPYSTGFNQKPIRRHLDTSDQQAKYKDEERHQRAEPTLPFELENLVDQLGATFVSLAELQRMLQNVKGNESVEDEDVVNLQDKIDKINNLILELPDDISKLSL